MVPNSGGSSTLPGGRRALLADSPKGLKSSPSTFQLIVSLDPFGMGCPAADVGFKAIDPTITRLIEHCGKIGPRPGVGPRWDS